VCGRVIGRTAELAEAASAVCSHPFWSADGQSIAFFAGGRLKRVAATGGDIVTICEARSGGGGTWSRDGTILFADGLDSPLKQVSAVGGSPTVLTALDASQGDSAHLHPVFHPDGRHFVFTVLSGARGGTYLGSLGSREIRKLVADTIAAKFVAPDHLAFVTRDGRLMAQRLDVERATFVGSAAGIAEGVDVNGPNISFSASASGALVYWSGSDDMTQPTWVTHDGKIGETLGPSSTYVNVAISPDGAHVAVDRFTPTPAIWMLDAARRTAARETAGGPGYQSTPVWSPDGRAIVYAQAKDTPPNLYSSASAASRRGSGCSATSIKASRKAGPRTVRPWLT
jgi:hypothetical protein